MLTKIKRYFDYRSVPPTKKYVAKGNYKKLVKALGHTYKYDMVGDAIRQLPYAKVSKYLVELLNSKTYDLRSRAANILVHYNVEALNDLYSLMSSQYSGTRENTSWCISEIFEVINDEEIKLEVIDKMIGYRTDSSPTVRQNTYYILSRFVKDEYKDYFLVGLADPSDNVKANCMHDLRNIGISVLDDVLGFINHEDSEVRIKASWIVSELIKGEISDEIKEKVIEHFLPVLNDENPIVRQNSAYIMKLIGDIRQMQDMLMLVDDPEDKVWYNTRDYLAGIGDSATDELIKIIHSDKENSRRRVSFVLSTIYTKPENTDSLRKYLQTFHELMNDKLDPLRQNISFLLSEVADIRSKEILENALNDSFNPVKYNAIIGLARLYNKIEDKSIKENYLKIINKHLNVDKLEGAAIEALGIIDNNDETVIESIVKHLRDKTGWIRESAVKALMNKSVDKKEEYLLDLINDENKDVQKIVKESLVKLNWTPTYENIEKIIPSWSKGLYSWESVYLAFVNNEMDKDYPNFYLLSQALKSFPKDHQHGAWIRAAQDSYKKNRSGDTAKCYFEAVFVDPDPASVAWQWLTGNVDRNFIRLYYNEPFNKNTAEKFRKKEGFNDFVKQKQVYKLTD